MTNKYALGNAVTLPATFTKLTDPFKGTYTAYDPVLPTLVVEHPDGVTKDTYTYPASAPIQRPATGAAGSGKYFAAILPDVLGTWKYQWHDPDATTPGLNEGSFLIVAAKIT